MAKYIQTVRAVWIAAAIAGMAGCGESEPAKPVAKPAPPTPVQLTVGGTVSGLAGSGLILQLNGANDLAVKADGKFIFAGVRLPDGSDYSVAIKTTPAKRTCEIKPVSAAFDNETLNIVAIDCTQKGRHR